ncbi:DUF6789 family protein [Desulfotruncus alcoholivorax]|uniref:DUF6789 family protein n=1 Tax=Desulfotruncus alcoholivorax TaxID=265477 RepID=UPI0003FA0195|nr:DUF6789 family protein [Desulfotruncus alcoholivorax]
MAISRIRRKTPTKQRNANITESYNLWEIIKYNLTAQERLSFLEDYIQDPDLRLLIKGYDDFLVKNIEAIEKEMARRGLQGPDRHAVDAQSPINPQMLNDRQIACESLLLVQGNVDLLTRTLEPVSHDEQLRSILIEDVTQVMDYRDEIVKYLKMNGLLETPTLFPPVPTVNIKHRAGEKNSAGSPANAGLLQKLKQDTLAIGTLAGITGTVVMHGFSILWNYLGLTKVTTLQVSGAILVAQEQLNTPLGLIISIIVHLMVGSVGGVLLAYYIKYAGKDLYWLKGLALSGFMLLAGMGFIVHVMQIMPQMYKDALTVFFHIINYLIYGQVVAYTVTRYWELRRQS